MQETASGKAPSRRREASSPPTTDRLRNDIDRGVTREKVAYPDPAAAPMGTDDEAAGASPSAQQRRTEQEARPTYEGSLGNSGRAISFYVGAALVAGALLILMAILLG